MSSSQDGYGGYPGQYNSYPPPGQGPPHPGNIQLEIYLTVS